MVMRITEAMASASGLEPEDSRTVAELVGVWRDNLPENQLRDAYYSAKVGVKDLGVSVSRQLSKKLDPRVDWAAKCVDWWSDRVQYEGVTCTGEEHQATLDKTYRRNDMKNLVHKTASSALKHCCAFMTVTAGHEDRGEPPIVVSGYPATAASAVFDEGLERITSGLVVVSSVRLRGSRERYPVLAYAFTDQNLIVLSRPTPSSTWSAEYIPHSMGRVPMEPIAYHATLTKPFGRSRITEPVMRLVDAAQREMENMEAAAAFSAWPQKYLMGADSSTAAKIAEEPFRAFIGSLFVGTTNKNGQIPQFGQLSQLTMQPHIDYMRSLASQFSGTTGVPVSSLGVISDNPSSAEAIYAGKEDAIVDIQGFVNACKHSLESISAMVVAQAGNMSYAEAQDALGTVNVNFANPAMPSVVSQSDAMVKQISAIPWLADSDVALRELGYTDEQIAQLHDDRSRSQGTALAMRILGNGETGAQGASEV